MKVGLIHATTTAIKPIEQAFQAEAPEIELLHFMDTSLLSLIESSGSLTPEIMRRFVVLLNMAADSNVDCIQLTCSAFNNITTFLQPLYSIKLFRSDEAMLDEALAYHRIGLISTVKETPEALITYLREKKPDCLIESLVDPGIIHLLFQGKKDEHDLKVKNMIREMDGQVDVIVLSQYSMEHVAHQIRTSVPILTAPLATVKRCLSYLQHHGS
ncbi:aspartate/glutamate racemase family protein [Heyndrickxia vini]|uniref:Asp/Glu/hydantoin racemase n=1 Tax=Heyndrickxia vini TaxID=1476025 RepID=A0ABX7DX76_9BACI|nr:aspartate/glutamate racemase family protein [Heyndrickxia vini]QQZ07723.1 hypothetical protein I5776_11515 [Heyndrickxia vini]